MLFSPQAGTKMLAELSDRLAISLEAGLDLRTVWAREAQRRVGRAARARLHAVSQAVAGGQSLSAALAAAGDFFPPLFRELAEVGEKTGHLVEVFKQLAEHYRGQLSLRRTFLAAIAWPMIELALAILVVGFLIWILGFIRKLAGTDVDILGLGLVGNTGLAIYIAFLVALGAMLLLVLQAVRRGLIWTRPIQRGVLRLPWLGRALETLALARLAWTLHLTVKVGMDVPAALRLSLQSAGNARFTDQIDPIAADIAAGSSIHEAFLHAGSYPTEFLDGLSVGEQTGKLDESMATLSGQYQERARVALSVLTVLAGLAVWGLVALVIIVLIFRLFGFYLGTIQDALPK